MKKSLLIAMASMVFAVANVKAGSPIANAEVKVVVIDAGHGGSDSGASYGGYHEKDVNLKVALALGKKIEERMPDVKVVYTRTTDTFIGRPERVDIALKAKAQVLLSVHTNGAGDSRACGTETTFFTVDDMVKGQPTVGVGRGSDEKYNGYNTKNIRNRHGNEVSDGAYKEERTMAQVGKIQTLNGEYSHALATHIQKAYKKSGRKMHGQDYAVKRGNFELLWSADLVSVITEVGFLSNPDDRAYITSEKGVNQIAEDIYSGFETYCNNIKKALKQMMEEEAELAASDSQNEASPAAAASTTAPAAASSAASQKGYAVQVMALDKPISVDDARFKSYRGKVCGYASGNGKLKYKYCVGFYPDRSSASKAAAEVRKVFGDAFVVEVDRSDEVH